MFIPVSPHGFGRGEASIAQRCDEYSSNHTRVFLEGFFGVFFFCNQTLVARFFFVLLSHFHIKHLTASLAAATHFVEPQLFVNQ